MSRYIDRQCMQHDPNEPLCQMNMRLPVKLFNALHEAAAQHQVSLAKLCIDKLSELTKPAKKRKR